MVSCRGLLSWFLARDTKTATDIVIQREFHRKTYKDFYFFKKVSICICVCIGVCEHGCKCTWMPEIPVGAIVGCPTWMVGIKLGSSLRVASTCICWTVSLQPLVQGIRCSWTCLWRLWHKQRASRMDSEKQTVGNWVAVPHCRVSHSPQLQPHTQSLCHLYLLHVPYRPSLFW